MRRSRAELALSPLPKSELPGERRKEEEVPVRFEVRALESLSSTLHCDHYCSRTLDTGVVTLVFLVAAVVLLLLFVFLWRCF